LSGFSADDKPMATFTAGAAGRGGDTATSVVVNGATNPLPKAIPDSPRSTSSAKPTIPVAAYSLAVVTVGP
jgi:hypothetical protein